MPRAAPILTTFNAGEWSPLLHGRVDLAKYPNACRRLENFLPLPQGAAAFRPGTRHVAATKDHVAVRLIPFEFSTVQAYVIEAGPFYFRFYREQGRIESAPGTPVEIATPYSADDLAGLKWAQSADVLFLVHPAHQPRRLTRASHTSWTLSLFEPKDGPYLDLNIGATTIIPSGVTGAVTLTASSALFQAGHVGAIFRLEEPTGTMPHKTWVAGEAVSSGALRQFGGREYQATNSATTGNTPPTHAEGTVSDGGVSWQFNEDGAGYVKITTVTDSTHASGTVISRLPDTNATKRWREGAWSAVHGYPAAVTFHEERLWFGGTPDRPQTLWSSAVGDFENFAPSLANQVVADDTALTLTIADDKVNAIRWLSSGKVLAIGTSGGEFSLQASNTNEAITPFNVTVRRETTRQCADVMPARVGASVLFVQRARRRLHEMGYTFESDSYQAPDLTLLAGHMLRPGIVEIAWQAEPFAVLWACLADGGLVGMTYMRDQQVVAWHRHPLGGAAAKVLSLTAIPAGEQDELWLVVEREIDGGTRRHVEFLEAPFWPASADDKDGAFHVDSGLSHAGAPVTVLSGLGRLEGETVAVLADGAVQPPRQVSGGAIALDRPASAVQAGLAYRGCLETLDIEAGAADGTAQARARRIHRVAVRLWATLGCAIGFDEVTLERVPFRQADDAMDASPPLFTGDRTIAFPKGWERAARVLVVQDQPLPCTVVAIMPRLVTGD